AAGTPPATTAPPAPPPGQQDADGNTVLVVVLAVAGGVALGVLLPLGPAERSERRSIRSTPQFAEVKATAQEDLDALADDLGNLNVNLQAAAADKPRADHP